MIEVWKDIPEYEGLYQVSNFGRIKSLERERKMNIPCHDIAVVHERILKPSISGSGYEKVVLSKDATHKTIRVHKLVAQAFVSNPDDKSEINHKDGNKKNNRADNLEWVTSKENQNHALLFGLRNDKLRRKTVNQYDLSGNFIRSWNGYVEIEQVLGIPRQRICACVKGRKKSAAGFVWRHE